MYQQLVMIRHIFRIKIIIKNTVSIIGFALGTNMIWLSFTNSNNTLGTLVSLGFASGTKYTLGIITTLASCR